MVTKSIVVNCVLTVVVIAVGGWAFRMDSRGPRAGEALESVHSDGEAERIQRLEDEVRSLREQLRRAEVSAGSGSPKAGASLDARTDLAPASSTASRGSTWDPTLNQEWLRGDPSEPPRLDPGNVDPEAPEWYNPYTEEHLKRPETVAEVQGIYFMNRSEEERVTALQVLRMAMIGGGQPKEDVYPEALAADAFELMRSMKDVDGRWKVLSTLGGLEYPVVRDEALFYLRNDSDPKVRQRAAKALAPFHGDPEVEEVLRSATWDLNHEVRSYAKAALKGDWRFNPRW